MGFISTEYISTARCDCPTRYQVRRMTSRLGIFFPGTDQCMGHGRAFLEAEGTSPRMGGRGSTEKIAGSQPAAFFPRRHPPRALLTTILERGWKGRYQPAVSSHPEAGPPPPGFFFKKSPARSLQDRCKGTKGRKRKGKQGIRVCSKTF